MKVGQCFVVQASAASVLTFINALPDDGTGASKSSHKRV